MKALTLDVYRPAAGYDCTNNGVSSRFKKLLLVCPEGFLEIDESNPPENLVRLVRRELFGEVVYHIEPAVSPDPGNVGWMAGGNFAHTCDSRLSRMAPGFCGALSVHDRQETRELNDLLSR